MHVGCRNDRFPECAAGVQYSPVKILKNFDGTDATVVHEKGVVADRLDLQIVVERSNLSQRIITLTAHDSSVKLAHAAGGTDQDPLPMLHQQALRDAGHLQEVVQIGLRYHLIEILETGSIQNQKDHMIGLLDIRAAQTVVDRLNVVYGFCPAGAQIRYELVHDSGNDHRIIRRPVMIELGQVQAVGDDIQFKPFQIRQQGLTQCQSIQKHRIKTQMASPRSRLHETDIKMRVMSNQRPVADVIQKSFHRFLFVGSPFDILVADACQLGDIGRNGDAGIHKGVERRQNFGAAENDCADLCHPIQLFVQTRRFNIEGNKLFIKR